MTDLAVREDVFPIAGTSTISRGSRTESRFVTVELTRDGVTGRAEWTNDWGPRRVSARRSPATWQRPA